MLDLYDYVSTNYARAKAVLIAGVTLYFSYSTLIAVTLRDKRTFVTTQKWSNTTRRHLGKVPYAQRYNATQTELEAIALYELRGALNNLNPTPTLGGKA